MDAYIQICNTLAMYAERIDAADFDGVGELFEHAVMTLDGAHGLETNKGAQEVADAFRSWARRYDDDGTLHTKHVISNIIADIDEDAGVADVRSYATVFQHVDGVLPLQPIMTGGYRDRFERRDGGDRDRWVLVRRHLYVDRVGDVSQHLLAGSPP